MKKLQHFEIEENYAKRMLSHDIVDQKRAKQPPNLLFSLQSALPPLESAGRAVPHCDIGAALCKLSRFIDTINAQIKS